MQFFENRLKHLNYREKFFLFAFLGSLVFVWSIGCVKQVKVLVRDWNRVSGNVKRQKYWIENEFVIQDGLNRILSVMDPKKTLSGASFAGEVENIVRSYNMVYSMTSPRTRKGSVFDAHTLHLHCENASVQDLILFEKNIYIRKPYLSLEKVKLHANLFNPELLEADCFLSALQLKDIIHE